MVQVIEAIYSEGVLKPISPLRLREQQRVRVYIQILGTPEDTNDSAALQEIMRDIEQSSLHLTEPLPSRDDLHDRSPAD